MGPYVHRVDPIWATVGGVHLWYYGLAYALGFLGLFLALGRARSRLGLSRSQVYDLTLLVAGGALAGGRLVEVLVYEGAFYRAHPGLIPALWLGGMSTHGLLAGALLGLGCFAWRQGRDLLGLADALAIPAALIMGFGRLGNFADGLILGAPTDLPWGVRFPEAPGFRHPVVLYDGLKNLLLVPLLMLGPIRRRRGRATAVFLCGYGLGRLLVDLVRDYPGTLFGFATGQVLNLATALAGVALAWRTRQAAPAGSSPRCVPACAPLGPRRAALLLLLAAVLTLPSDWTQDVPARYGRRHPGLRHSRIYPPLQELAPR